LIRKLAVFDWPSDVASLQVSLPSRFTACTSGMDAGNQESLRGLMQYAEQLQAKKAANPAQS
jgi:hypothetical protein